MLMTAFTSQINSGKATTPDYPTVDPSSMQQGCAVICGNCEIIRQKLRIAALALRAVRPKINIESRAGTA
jgi:hypothetical protein